MARRLAPLGEVKHNAFMLRFAAEGHDFTVFPDGRAIIKGTNDIAKAQDALLRSSWGVELGIWQPKSRFEISDLKSQIKKHETIYIIGYGRHV